MNQVIDLKIRSLIADKERITAEANHDLSKLGEWRCDYGGWYKEVDDKLQELFKQQENYEQKRTKSTAAERGQAVAATATATAG